MTGTETVMLGITQTPFTKTYPTSQTHSLPLYQALVGQVVDAITTVGALGTTGTTTGVTTTVTLLDEVV